MKKTIKSGIVIIIVILIIAELCGCTYQNNKNQENFDSNNTSAKNIDNSKELVYTWFSATTNDYSYSIPTININSDDVKAINTKIQADYKTDVDEEIARANQGLSVEIASVKYDSYVNDNILSLVVNSSLTWDSTWYEVYNIDIYTGKAIDNTQLLQYKNVSSDDFLNKLPKLYEDKFIELSNTKDTYINNLKEAPANFTAQEIEDNSNFYTEQLNKTISKDNYGINTPIFLDSNGNLKLVANIYSLAGSDSYYYIINLEKEKASEPKTGNSKELVSTWFSDITEEYSYSIPIINIDSDDVKAINKKIQEDHKTDVDEEIAYFKEGCSVGLYSIEYVTYLNNNILSLVVDSKYPGDDICYEVYNILHGKID